MKAGDTLIVLTGETIPTDGILTAGTATVDQSVMTGESLPVDKTAGDTVIGGTVNRQGVFEYTATAEAADSSLQKMIDLAREADGNKAPIVRLADKWAAWLVAAAFTAAVLTFLVNRAFFTDPSAAFLRAVTVLVVVCPCAFILATPTAIMAGIGNATRYGMIVKSGEALQRFGTIDTVAFDKTGTLTCGKLSVVDIRALSPEFTRDAVLTLAAVAEARSEHPIGQAIRTAASTAEQASAYMVTPGKGIAAAYKGRRLLLGKADFLKEQGIALDAALADAYGEQGATVVFLAVDGKAAGLAALSDTLRESAAPMVRTLQNMHVASILLTGDNPAAAQHMAAKAGVSAVRSGLLPQDKQRIIREWMTAQK